MVTEVVVEETRMKEVAEDHSVRMRRCEACLALEPVDKEEESVQEQTLSVSEQEQGAAQDSQLSCSGTGWYRSREDTYEFQKKYFLHNSTIIE